MKEVVFQFFILRGNVVVPWIIYINVKDAAEAKGLKSTCSLRMAINKGKYKARTAPVNGGYSYEIFINVLIYRFFRFLKWSVEK